MKGHTVVRKRYRYVLGAFALGIVFLIIKGFFVALTLPDESEVSSSLSVWQLLFGDGPIDSLNLCALTVCGYIIGVNQEQKDEIRNGARLRQSYLHGLFEYSPQPILILNLDSTIADLNQAAIKLYRKPKETIIGRRNGEQLRCVNAQDSLCGDSEVCRDCPAHRLFKRTLKNPDHDHGSVEAEITVVKEDQAGGVATRHFQLKSSMIETETGPKVLMAMSDVSKLVDTTHALERSNASRSHFISMISHNLRTPLNPIIGLGDILENELRGPELEMLQTMNEAARRELHIVDNLIEYTEISSSDSQPIREPEVLGVQLRELFEHFSEQAIDSYDKSVFEFENGFDDFVELRDEWIVWSDGNMIKRAIHQIMENAQHFTVSGKITMRVGLGDSNQSGYEHDVVIQVQDTGCGMNQHEISELMKPFERVETDGALTGKGLGLGLAITSEILRKLKGTISIESKVDEGTCVTIRVPVSMTILSSSQAQISSLEASHL